MSASAQQHFDVVIIGAGLSGLAAGLRARHLGKSTLILEKHSVWGGLNSFYKKGGHHFDVGLHAITNWVTPAYRGPRVPLQRVCRQLRIRLEELGLEPQSQSAIVFDDCRLTFSNDLQRLVQGVRDHFPAEVDGFVRLGRRCVDYPPAGGERPFVSSRAILAEYISDPLLTEMILCPLMFYGSAVERDVDFDQFVILFNSIYREGLCRPRRGIRQILDVLVKKFKKLGGEMRRGCAVESLVVRDGRIRALTLEKGDAVGADVVFSSAGRVETERLRSDRGPGARVEHAGQLAFMENMWVLDRDPAELGFGDSIVFYNHGPRFSWRRPCGPVDLASGVVCVPSNFQHDPPSDRWLIRTTHLANHERWFGLDAAAYRAAKARWAAESARVTARVGGPFVDEVRYTDGFTPRTVTHYTGHINGAVYGSPQKVRTGRTDLENLFLCGTDQGLLGVVGAMLSGIVMINAHAQV